jgi:glycerol-3-phosphate dehydrogenase
VFVVPQGDRTYVGTTDTDYEGPIDDPKCTPEDIEYLLSALNHSIVEPLTLDDITGTWAGLRPLVRNASSSRTADLSRRHTVVASDSGVVSVMGGKLTTYRKMAADTVDVVAKRLGKGGRSRTKSLLLHGAAGHEELRADGAAARLGVDATVLEHLVGRYGGEARALVAMVDADPSLGQPLVPTLPHLRAEAIFAARYEMAVTLDDILTRRIPARWLAAEAAASVADEVARLVAPELGWSEAEVAEQASAFRAAVTADRTAAGLSSSEIPV